MSRLLRGAAALASLIAAAVSALYAAALITEPGTGAARLFPAQAYSAGCLQTAACSPEAARLSAPRRPLHVAALEAELARLYGAGGAEAQFRLATLVHRHNPRSELARIVLAEAALSGGDQDRFLGLFLPVFQTDRRQTALYADVLANLSRDAAVFDRVARYLREERPGWAGAYLGALTHRGELAPGALVGLYAEFPEAQAAFLQRLVQGGNHAGAYLAFNEFVSGGALARAYAPALSVPYNPALHDLAAPAPFNWRLNRQGAEWLAGGGVYAFYQGRRAETFLSQTFPLAPGNWELSARISGDVAETGGNFRWRMTCAPTGKHLAEADILQLSSAPSRRTYLLAVPRGSCDFVTLSLVGVPGTFPQPARIELRDLDLRRPELVPEPGTGPGEATQ